MSFFKNNLHSTKIGTSAGHAFLFATAIETMTGGISAIFHIGHGNSHHDPHTNRHERNREAVHREAETTRNGRRNRPGGGVGPNDLASSHVFAVEDTATGGVQYYTTRRMDDVEPVADEMQPVA